MTYESADFFFFFKQKTAYEIMPSLVGSEMCIRDRGKYVVPYFHKAVTVTADLAVRLTAAVFFSAVIIDLGARTAWTCAMLPEIVTLSGLGVTVESCDTLCRHTDFLRPDVERLVILPVDRRIKSCLLYTSPSPRD